jgi:hypothetical protein
MNLDLEKLSILTDNESRSISAENPTGEKGGGAKAAPDEKNPASELGIGWKVRPCINLEQNSTATLAEITGPGMITHIWMTVDEKAYRSCVLRFYWDEETSPSVEVPIGDFFANGHGLRYNVNSLPVVVNPSGGFNCYWKMPFRKHCKITIENPTGEMIKNFFYQISYELKEISSDAGYFHAQWRRERLQREKPEHVILDSVKGKGNYIGTFVAWIQYNEGWWGEGEVKFYLDDDVKHPTICGTGTEDYFGGAWCFRETYSTPFLGYPLWVKGKEINKHAVYRWHVPDPIRFHKNLRVTIQALGWYPDGKFQPLNDDIASVAYWYQNEPHEPFPPLPDLEERRGRA